MTSTSTNSDNDPHIALNPERRLTRRQEALLLADELLRDIELSNIDPMSLARKAGRLARLIDDAEAMQWLAYETTGYPSPLDGASSRAAQRSCRGFVTEDGTKKVKTAMLGQLASVIDSAQVDLGLNTGGTSSSEYAVIVERNKAAERAALRRIIEDRQGLLDKIIGAIHQYVAEMYQQLRFGSAVESAFEVVRAEVDSNIATLVPDAIPMVTAALENASSDNPEHWQAAASTCRRLLMTAADQLRPAGPDVGGRKMGPGNYVNRLVDWIVSQADSDTAAKMIATDLEYLGPRLDAADGAGQKGAHVGTKPVTRFEASRYVTGTYLVLGDILRVRSLAEPVGPEDVSEPLTPDESAVVVEDPQ